MGFTVIFSSELSHSISWPFSLVGTRRRWCAERMRRTPRTIMNSRKPTHTTMMATMPKSATIIASTCINLYEDNKQEMWQKDTKASTNLSSQHWILTPLYTQPQCVSDLEVWLLKHQGAQVDTLQVFKHHLPKW